MAEELGIAPGGRAPHLGEHTRLVLTSDLGLSAAQIDALAAAGVIRLSQPLAGKARAR
jgi:crotonobetainyl-CoA:carnitine CoA-transferase CaiB-like acyl-CoA transferase